MTPTTSAGLHLIRTIPEIPGHSDRDRTRIDLECVRQHLIGMNGVTLRSSVRVTHAPGGLSMNTMGTGRRDQAIRRVVVPHTVVLKERPVWSARTGEILAGLRLMVHVGVREGAAGRAQVMVPASAAMSNCLTSWSPGGIRSRSCCSLTLWVSGSSW